VGYIAVVTTAAGTDRVWGIASDQWGLVTRRQVEDAGVAATTLDRLTAAGGVLDRVALGVYQLRGAPVVDHRDLRAAWLQLAPEVFVWDRTPEQGVVSHRSAAAVYGIGQLPADVHEFTVPSRRQSRRRDVRIHVRPLADEVVVMHSLPVTRPARIVADLLREREDPEAVAQLVADALRGLFEYPGTVADAVAPYAQRFGFDRGDGRALLGWFGETTASPDVDRWLTEARGE
jgi:predicted transcriptional regulator of viral defense system